MLTAGITILAFGVLYAAFKAFVVWDIAHDLFNGGGPPTLDFPIFCPIPLALGGNLVLRGLGKQPFPGFGYVAYICLVVVFGFLLWLFYRLGAPERKRQLQELQNKHRAANEPDA
jgi:hypothetical protein